MSLILLINFINNIFGSLRPIATEGRAWRVRHVPAVFVVVAAAVLVRHSSFIMFVVFQYPFFILGFTYNTIVGHIINSVRFVKCGLLRLLWQRDGGPDWISQFDSCAPRNRVEARLLLAAVVRAHQQIFTPHVCYFRGI